MLCVNTIIDVWILNLQNRFIRFEKFSMSNIQNHQFYIRLCIIASCMVIVCGVAVYFLFEHHLWISRKRSGDLRKVHEFLLHEIHYNFNEITLSFIH